MSAVRQSTQPISYDMTRRMDNRSVRTSSDAGVVAPIALAPLFRGDSASGRIMIDLDTMSLLVRQVALCA